MSVTAVVVVHRQHVGVLFGEELRESRSRVDDVGARECFGSIVRRFAGHAGVVETEELHAIDAEDLGGRELFPHAHLRERRSGRHRSGRGLAQFAPSCHDEHDAMALDLRLRHRAGGRDGLVVGMRMEHNERVGHELLLAGDAPGDVNDRPAVAIVPLRQLTLASHSWRAWGEPCAGEFWWHPSSQPCCSRRAATPRRPSRHRRRRRADRLRE